MSDDKEEGAFRIGRLPALALGLSVLMASAIVYNTLIDGAGKRRIARNTLQSEDTLANGGGKLIVDGADTATITLRYDPVVEAVQRELAGSGFYRGPVDGVYGKRTRKAILDYEQAAGLPETGKATPSLIDHIRFNREITRAAKFTGSLEDAPVAVSAGLEDAESVLRVQRQLAELGYSPGPQDGMLKPETRAALSEFERDRGLTPAGEITPEILAELAKVSGSASE